MTTLLGAYTWSDAANKKWAICNSKFAYGTITSTVFNGPPWKTLSIGNTIIGNEKLVTVNLSNSLKINVKGIYKLRVNLVFSGSPDGTTENINFSLSTLDINGTPWGYVNLLTTPSLSNEIITSSYNATSKILSFGNLYSTSTDLVLFNGDAVQFQIFSQVPLKNGGFSLIENTLYLVNETNLYFNISGEGTTPVNLYASGNFTLELLYAV